MNHWLLKIPPEKFDWQEVLDTGRFELHSVRRLFSRDNLIAMKLGDEVLFYSVDPIHCYMGVLQVEQEAHQDNTTTDSRWVSVTFQLTKVFYPPVPLCWVQKQKGAGKIPLDKFPRLAVIPLLSHEFYIICKANEQQKESDSTKISGITILLKKLMARFYPFSQEELFQHADNLYPFAKELIHNKEITWNEDLLDHFKYAIPWGYVFYLKGLTFDEAFFKKYASFIHYEGIFAFYKIAWTENILEQCRAQLNWEQVISNPFFARADILDSFKKGDKIWHKISANCDFSAAPDLIDRYANKLNWDALSGNRNIPLSVAFIQKYLDRLNFDRLSSNPAALPLIYEYPASQRWNWKKVIQNTALVYDDAIYQFMLHHFTKYLVKHEKSDSIWSRYPERYFFFSLFHPCRNDVRFFLNERFIDLLPKDCLARLNSKPTESFYQLLKQKGLVNVSDRAVIGNIAHLIDEQFLEEHMAEMNPISLIDYRLPLSQKLFQCHP